MVYDIVPVAKPRMTQQDVWKKRPCVMKYWSFKDECKRKGVKLKLHGQHITFGMPMAKSWTKKEKAERVDTPHQQKKKNDVDNLLKALMDAVFGDEIDDGFLWDIRVTKVWSYTGYIMIRDIYE